MSNNSTNNVGCPVIAGVMVTTDKSGRYNLNAIHKASGSEKKNSPNYWLALQGTQDLISELENNTTEISVVTKEGRNGGTFAHELLAISYAGWISPRFQLQVNQVFIDYRLGNLQQKQERDIARVEYRPMTDAIKFEREQQGKEIKPYHFSNEVDLINRIALGMTAAKFREHHDISKNKPIRDILTDGQLKCVTDLQRANTVYIQTGLEFADRKEALTVLFNRNHKQLLIDELERLES